MRPGPEDFRRHYASLSDEALLALDRSELVETAQRCYDEELAQRGLDSVDGVEAPEEAGPFEEGDDASHGPGDWDSDDAAPPEWLHEAACACAFAMDPGGHYAAEVSQARAALRAAGIPCSIIVNETEPQHAGAPPRHECCLMVPGALMLHAAGVLDRDVFNARQEADWRAHFEDLSDEDLCALDPAIFCAGLLDRAARLKRAHADELNRRGLGRR